MAECNRKRRSFLAALIAGMFSLVGWKFLTPRLPDESARLTVEKRTVPPDGALVFREKRVAVVREEAGFIALDLTCTHLGCTVAATPSGLSCPCHGSTFDSRGRVISGPATRPLARYRVEDAGERLVVVL